MAKKTTKTTKTETTVAAAPAAKTTKRASSPPTPVKDAAVEAAYAAPARTVAPVVTPVAAAPVTTPVVPAKTVTPVEKVAAAKVVETPVANAPVKVVLKKGGQDVQATIRYQGNLAKAGADKLVAVLGVEWFGSPRWQRSQDIELKKAKDGTFEAQVQLSETDARGAQLMALQMAFTTVSRQAWDSAGVPYGYYQVSALTGAVETVPN